MKRVVSPEQARRVAVRAQLLDGSGTTVLDTVRSLAFPLDPIATVATPQQLALFGSAGTGSSENYGLGMIPAVGPLPISVRSSW